MGSTKGKMRWKATAALWWALLGIAFLFFSAPQQADAAFHIMNINEVMAGANGYSDIQFVELQMEASGQNLVSGHTIDFYNAGGTITGTFTFPSNVGNAANGSSILIGTTAFASASSVAPDFTMSSDIMAPDGRVCFQTIDCVAYGNYTGSNSGYGTPAAALPITGNSSLKRGTNTNNNINDFTLGAPAPRNNAGLSGTVTPPPAAPTSLTAADTPNVQGGSVDLAWTPSASVGMTEQRIYRATSSGGPYALVATTTTSTSAYTDSGLTDGTTYYYVVRAFDGTAESGDSNEDSATPADNIAPQPPTNLTALDRPTDQGSAVIIAWVLSTSTDVTQQRLFRATSPGGPYTEFANFDENTTFHIDTGLSDGVTYYYVVRAFDGTAESGDSNEDSAAPLDNTAPQPPTGLTAVDRPNDGGGTIELAWAPSTSTDVTELRVYRSVTSTGPYSLVATTTSSTSAYTDSGLTHGTTYYYVVRAYDGTSEGADSNEDPATPVDDPLLAPTGLTAADRPGDQGGEIDIAWTPSTSLDATEQRVYRSVTSTGPYSLVATTTSSTTAYTDSGLTDGTTYYYVVRAFDGSGESPDSNEDSATPVDNLVPPAPTGLTAADRPDDNGGAIDIAWTPSASGDVTQQRIYRGTTSGSHPTLVTTINDDTTGSYTDTGLTDETTYFYVVRAFDGANESGASNEDSGTPVNDIAIALPGLGLWGLVGLAGLIAAALMWQSRRAVARRALRSSAP